MFSRKHKHESVRNGVLFSFKPIQGKGWKITACNESYELTVVSSIEGLQETVNFIANNFYKKGGKNVKRRR